MPAVNDLSVLRSDRAGASRRPTNGNASRRYRPAGQIPKVTPWLLPPLPTASQGDTMLKWALIFALISIVAGVLGFTGIAAGAASIAKIFFYIFLTLFVLVIVAGVLGFKAFTGS
jgi:uncharacterized membrane protein YtjA (UPF0391 family)